MKKFIAAAVAVLMCAAAFAGCKQAHKHKYDYVEVDWYTHKKTCTDCDEVDENLDHDFDDEADETCDTCGFKRDMLLWGESFETRSNLSADGYVKDNIGDFSQYVGTDAYRTVSTADELISAIKEAKYDYTNVWDDETKTYTQTLNAEGTVHVIEITQDLNLGYNVLSSSAKSSGIVDNFASKYNNLKDWLYFSEMFLENGISQIKVENTSNLLIYSKNGAKITHAGFKLTSDTNVVFRNLQFDEMWQWEDAPVKNSNKIGDYDWFGWAYFKIAFCGYIWIDHCTFGKSYDGQIDYSNPVYDANAGTAFRAPYGATGPNGLHISWCKFNAGSDDKEGYIYKMMSKIEQDYQSGKTNCLYYKALRDGGISFEDILYGLAIPQKKGFLCGDSGNGKEDYDYNLKLQISFANCTFKNLEDRLPKLRGGNAYMYNCIVDSSQYYGYRTKLRSASAASKISALNSSWKCALVSQGIVCGNGGSFKAENCIFKGIDYLLKNNDSGGKNEGGVNRPVAAGYQLTNCSYQKTADATPTTTNFTNDSSGILKTENFSWHTVDGNAPFTISAVELDGLEAFLGNTTFGAGVTTELQERLLKSKYGV